MTARSDRNVFAAGLLAVALALPMIGGCESDETIVSPAGSARVDVAITFPTLAGKADFDLAVTLFVEEEGQEGYSISRTIYVFETLDGWIARDELVVPAGKPIRVDAQAEVGGLPYFGYGFLEPLEPGATTSLEIQMR